MAKSIKNVSDAGVSSVEKYLNTKYCFRHNPILERTEFKMKSDKTFQLLSERDVNSICRELNNNDKKCSISALRSLLNSDFVEEINPFVEYFTQLPIWDGKTDYIDQLARTVKADNKVFWAWSFKKWIVNLVACAIDKGINQHVLVFVGKQGIGKTTWLNNLVPAPLEGYLYCGIVNPSNKDTLVSLSENLIINLDELENLNKNELGSLKSLITQSAIRLRRSYGIYNENYVRRASFVGSVNEVEFLTDTTGNRRYLVIETTDIDFKHKVDLDKVYSQAYSLLNSGEFQFVFSTNDIEQIDDNNQKFIRQSVEEELLLKHYRRPKENDTVIELLTTTDVLMKLQDKTKLKLGDPSSIRRLGNALQKYKFQRISKGNSKPYQLVSMDENNHQNDGTEVITPYVAAKEEPFPTEFNIMFGDVVTTFNLDSKLHTYGFIKNGGLIFYIDVTATNEEGKVNLVINNVAEIKAMMSDKATYSETDADNFFNGMKETIAGRLEKVIAKEIEKRKQNN